MIIIILIIIRWLSSHDYHLIVNIVLSYLVPLSSSIWFKPTCGYFFYQSLICPEKNYPETVDQASTILWSWFIIWLSQSKLVFMQLARRDYAQAMKWCWLGTPLSSWSNFQQLSISRCVVFFIYFLINFAF